MPTIDQSRLAPARPENHRIGIAGLACPSRVLHVSTRMAGVAMSGTAQTSKPSNSQAGNALLCLAVCDTPMQGRQCIASPSTAQRSFERQEWRDSLKREFAERSDAWQAAPRFARPCVVAHSKAGEAAHGRAQQAQVSPGRRDQSWTCPMVRSTTNTQTAAGERGINGLHLFES